VNTIDVPARGRKWVIGALVLDSASNDLYRVAGKPIRYHEDCLPSQKVTKVRDVPEEWQAVRRLLAIMEQVKADGTHTPASRGAHGLPKAQVAERPMMPDAVQWEARRDERSYASYPRLHVSGEHLSYVESIYDDAPIVTWLTDATLAEEARGLIARKLSLCQYPLVHIHNV
jgi:hypothetical protein